MRRADDNDRQPLLKHRAQQSSDTKSVIRTDSIFVEFKDTPATVPIPRSMNEVQYDIFTQVSFYREKIAQRLPALKVKIESKDIASKIAEQKTSPNGIAFANCEQINNEIRAYSANVATHTELEAVDKLLNALQTKVKSHSVTYNDFTDFRRKLAKLNYEIIRRELNPNPLKKMDQDIYNKFQSLHSDLCHAIPADNSQNQKTFEP